MKKSDWLPSRPPRIPLLPSLLPISKAEQAALAAQAVGLVEKKIKEAQAKKVAEAAAETKANAAEETARLAAAEAKKLADANQQTYDGLKTTADTTAAASRVATIDSDTSTERAAELKAEAALIYRQVEVAKRPPPPPAPTADELAAIAKNKDTGRLLLQKFEENARTTMNKYMKQL
jgi:hypothetical protein